ncbi:SPFH domain-containing protein [Bacillus solimangrovi]|uniref:Uncharacterized protein n=1 Tax=Bacillus solimangrovi TaxID=1305675 RepID=A0A1E5LB89_9BACI|nr:SPFH domain-containing protein [Bacillus solimangrovi]OEH91346.1 hypothetical protein BFG57_05630 [Bacillus solimangrovi]
MGLILNKEEVKFNLFASVPSSSKEIALVYIDKQGNNLVLKDGDRMHKSEHRFGKYHTYYEVDMKKKELKIDKEFVSSEEIYTFNLSILFDYRVEDPVLIVQEYDNPQIALEEKIFYILDGLVCKYSIEEKQILSEEIRNLNNNLDVIQVFRQFGLKLTDVHGNVKLGERARKNLEKSDDITQSKKIHEEHSLKDILLANYSYNEALDIMEKLESISVKSIRERKVILSEIEADPNINPNDKRKLINHYFNQGGNLLSRNHLSGTSKADSNRLNLKSTLQEEEEEDVLE